MFHSVRQPAQGGSNINNPINPPAPSQKLQNLLKSRDDLMKSLSKKSSLKDFNFKQSALEDVAKKIAEEVERLRLEELEKKKRNPVIKYTFVPKDDDGTEYFSPTTIKVAKWATRFLIVGLVGLSGYLFWNSLNTVDSHPQKSGGPHPANPPTPPSGGGAATGALQTIGNNPPPPPSGGGAVGGVLKAGADLLKTITPIFVKNLTVEMGAKVPFYREFKLNWEAPPQATGFLIFVNGEKVAQVGAVLSHVVKAAFNGYGRLKFKIVPIGPEGTQSIPFEKSWP